MTRNESKIEAIVFDMDGVIIDSEPVWQQVRVDLVSEHRGTWTDRDGDATVDGPQRSGHLVSPNVWEES